jgi:hypothetical protein
VCVERVEDCFVVLHKASKADFGGVDPEEHLVLIRSPSKSTSAAYERPHLVSSQLLDDILDEDFLKSTWNVQSWQTIFQMVTKSFERGAESSEIADVTRRTMTAVQGKDAITPRKKRIRFEEDVAETFEEYEKLSSLTAHTVQLDADPPKTAEDLFRWLRALALGLDEVEEGRKRTQLDLKTFKESMSKNIDMVEAKIAADRVIVGERPPTAGTMDI